MFKKFFYRNHQSLQFNYPLSLQTSCCLISATLASIKKSPLVDLKRIFLLAESILNLGNEEQEKAVANLLLDGVLDDQIPQCNSDGLLKIVKLTHSSDSRRAYACVKFLAQSSAKSKIMKVMQDVVHFSFFP